MYNFSRNLIRFGLALFLLGLLTGLLVPVLHNPRMGLSSHLEGILNGIFLMVIGGIWRRFRLSARLQSVSFALVLFGTYANWATTLLAAMWGTGSMTPIAASGLKASPAQELLVNAGLIALTVAMIVSCGIFLWGLRGSDVDESAHVGA